MSEAIIFHCDVEICGCKIKKGTFVRQKEWVGLTDEEARDISFNLPIKWTGHLQGAASIYDFARAIEAKLKEKNT